jgi:hypothetical protein
MQMPYYNNGANISAPPISNNMVAGRAIPQPGFNPRPQPKKSPIRRIYAQKTTKNKSFLDMHHYLKSIGIKNNEFMLTLIDPDLDGIDPYDPNLNGYYKQKILMECIRNYWYFLREVVRLPSNGAKPVRFKLSRGNLALAFCQCLNLNVFFEMPRQQGKTIAGIIRFFYVYNFGTTNSKIAFLHKNMDGAKDNLQSLKDIRDLLPPYLIMKERVMPDGKVDRGKNNTNEILNPHNNNNIKVFASATNKAKAASLLRGKTLTMIWYDEYAFLPYNDTIYMNAAPAYKTAAMNAKKNGAPFGILITTTPGFMTTAEGQEAYHTKEMATKFSESWYDLTYVELMNILEANTKSDFVYIKFTYQQLGCSEQWFKEVCKLLKDSWTDIRREILLEWATGVENSPFKEEDLDAISGLLKQPISEVYILGKYRFETYLQVDTMTYPALIGVDVSGGYKQDSSTITVVDSFSTKVLGCMNCNYISTLDLARCIEFIVKNWMPNAIVNVERNGGFGSTVISKLIKMGLKRNLYYEIKDVVVEEKQDGIHAYKQKMRTKVYGLNSTKAIRQLLIDILIERVENHKDKIISPIIYNELLGMEIKRNGKVEHSSSTHDDQVFSMLMALYMWYEGVNMAERFGMRKTSIKTDDEVDEQIDYYNDDTVEIVDHFNTKDELDNEIEKDLNNAIVAGGQTMQQFLDKRREEEKIQFESLVNTPLGEKAFRNMYNIPDDVPLTNFINNGAVYNIPYHVFAGFYNPDDSTFKDYADNVPNMQVAPGNMAYSLEDEEYKYNDHFNF